MKYCTTPPTELFDIFGFAHWTWTAIDCDFFMIGRLLTGNYTLFDIIANGLKHVCVHWLNSNLTNMTWMIPWLSKSWWWWDDHERLFIMSLLIRHQSARIRKKLAKKLFEARGGWWVINAAKWIKVETAQLQVVESNEKLATFVSDASLITDEPVFTSLITTPKAIKPRKLQFIRKLPAATQQPTCRVQEKYHSDDSCCWLLPVVLNRNKSVKDL